MSIKGRENPAKTYEIRIAIWYIYAPFSYMVLQEKPLQLYLNKDFIRWYQYISLPLILIIIFIQCKKEL